MWQAHKFHCRVFDRSVPRPARVATSVVLRLVAQVVSVAAMETEPDCRSVNRSYFSELYSLLRSLTSHLLFHTERPVVEVVAAAAADDDDKTLLWGYRQLAIRF